MWSGGLVVTGGWVSWTQSRKLKTTDDSSASHQTSSTSLQHQAGQSAFVDMTVPSLAILRYGTHNPDADIVCGGAGNFEADRVRTSRLVPESAACFANPRGILSDQLLGPGSSISHCRFLAKDDLQ